MSTEDQQIATAQQLFDALNRKANRRKSNRESAQRKRQGDRPMAQRAKAPEIYVPRDWPAEEKARWVNALCLWLTNGGSLASFCREYPDGPAQSQWFIWVRDDPMIQEAYTRARENGADTLAEETVSIADEVKDAGHMDSARVNAARLRVDARKWVASKLKPKTYADRLETVQSGSLTVTHSVSDEDRARVLALLLTRQTVQGASSLVEAQRRIASHSIIEGQVIESSLTETKPKDQ